MKVMVTGGAGYVGCCLVPALLEAGARVCVVDKLIFGKKGLACCSDRIDFKCMDIREIGPQHLQKVDSIIHLAGLSNDPTAEYDPAANKAINFDATVRLAKIAKAAGVRRFLFASSCSVYYTEKPDDKLRDEDYPVAPVAPYSWSKRQAEIQLLKLGDGDFCPVVLRKGTIFGYSTRMRYDLVVNTFTRDAYARRCLNVHAGGRMWRPVLHIDDAVEVYMAALTAYESEVGGQIFNVLSENYQVIDIAKEVQRVIQKSKQIPINLIISPPQNSRSYRVAGDKLREKLGIKLKGNIKIAVEEIWKMLEKDVDYDSPIYYNIRWMESLCDKKEQRRIQLGESVI